MKCHKITDLCFIQLMILIFYAKTITVHCNFLHLSSVCVYILYFFLFTQNKNSDFCAPLTSFDWNEVDPNLLGTSSIDTTCTIWGLEVIIIAFLHGLSQYCIVTTVELSLSTMDDLGQRHVREVKVSNLGECA